MNALSRLEPTDVLTRAFRTPDDLDAPFRAGLADALRELATNALVGKVVGAFARHLADVQGYARAIAHLRNVLDLPGHGRGCLAMLDLAVRFQKLGIEVVAMDLPVLGPEGRAVTDIDILLANGTAVESRDWASELSKLEVVAKFGKQLPLVGTRLGGVEIRRLALYAPGGISRDAKSWCVDRGILVLTTHAKSALEQVR